MLYEVITVPVILKRYRQSVLTAAVNGRLTEKWREEHPDMEIKEILLNDIIISKPRNGYSPTPVKYKTDVKSLTLTATTSGLFDGVITSYSIHYTKLYDIRRESLGVPFEITVKWFFFRY